MTRQPHYARMFRQLAERCDTKSIVILELDFQLGCALFIFCLIPGPYDSLSPFQAEKGEWLTMLLSFAALAKMFTKDEWNTIEFCYFEVISDWSGA